MSTQLDRAEIPTSGQADGWPKATTTAATSIVMTLLLLCASVDAIGVLSPSSNRVLYLLILAALAVQNFSRQAAPGWAGISLAGLSLLPYLTRDPSLWIWAAAGFLAVLDKSSQSPGRLRALSLSTVLFGGFYLLYVHVPWLWLSVQAWSVGLSSALAAASGVELRLGAEASGFWVVAAYACVCAAHVLLACSPNERWLGIACLLQAPVAFVLYLTMGVLHLPDALSGLIAWLQEPTTKARNPDAAAIVIHMPLFLLALQAGFAAWLLPKVRLTWSERNGRWRLGALAAALALGVLASFHPGSVANGARVLFCDRGMVHWESPDYTRYGLQQAGMFGLLPRYLNAAGFQSQLTDEDEPITDARLADADVLVVINPTAVFAQPEHDAIWRFVARGGGLLVMGDHTDLSGMMEPLRSLLHPVGIRFAFDSAFTLRHWDADYRFRPHSTTRRLDWSNHRLQHSTGASLILTGDARPIVTLHTGFSDKGEASNSANGFLGDYRYQIDEQLSGLPIVAEARHGSGRVVVFGDTSAFQNIAVAHSAPFLYDVFSYLGDESQSGPLYPRDLALALLGVALAGVLAASSSTSLVAGTCALVSATGTLVGAALDWQLEFPYRGPNVALIDASHVNRFSLSHWEKDSIGGLQINLARAGFVPIVLERADRPNFDEVPLYVSIAPARPFSSAEIERLTQFMHRGGHVILATGWEERHGALPLLEALGVELLPRPLGPVPVVPKTNDPGRIHQLKVSPHFKEAWATQATPSFDETYYRTPDSPIVGKRNVGDGGLVFISDSHFLLDGTLEEENSWWLGNIEFIRGLLQEVGNQEQVLR